MRSAVHCQTARWPFTPSSAPDPAVTRERVKELDLLRFGAALMVVLYHYAAFGPAKGLSTLHYPALAPIAQYGFLGVELFFMISGFVILMSASGGSVRRFVVSRVVRLYPAFWVCCTLTFLVTLLIGAPKFSASVSQYLWNLPMIAGFFHVPPIDGSYWTLYVELRFYALVAAVLLLRQMHRVEGLLQAWFAVILVLHVQPLRGLNTLLIPNFACYFIAGAVCYLIWDRGATPLRLGLLAGTWSLAEYSMLSDLAGASMGAGSFAAGINPVVVALAISVLFAVMLCVALRRTGRLGRGNWVGVGALTYPLYLLHQYIADMVFNRAYPGINPHLLFWSVVVSMLLAAYAAHRWVERPLAGPLKAALNRWLDTLEARFSLP